MERISFNVSELSFSEQELNEAFASVSLNPTFRWCKFVLTDDQPNGNKHRIPEEEFDNLIRTGVSTPIKMATGHIADGHEGATPIGVIHSLTKTGNKILGLAALWSQERKEDVELIKKQYDDGNPVNLSWEVLYASSQDEDNGVKVLRDTVLRATTFVGLPAYQGRTPILQVAAMEGTNLELEQAMLKIGELETSLANLQTDLTQKITELDSVKSEKEVLASYKANIEAELAKVEKIQVIQNKFKEAGIEKDEQYFTENAEKLLGLGDSEFDFMLQEFVSFASKLKTSTASQDIPNFTSTDKLSPKEIANKLRNSK